MTKIKYNMDIIKYVNLFESITGAKLKDCIADSIADNRLTFVVHEGEIGKAIGKNGSNAKRLENLIKKRIRIVEFSSNPENFVKNLIRPVSADVKQEGNIVIMIVHDSKSKGVLIGRDRSNLNMTKGIVKRYFDVEDIKVM